MSMQPWLPRKTPDVCLGQETLPKSATPPSKVLRLGRQLWTILGYLCADVAPPLAKLIVRRRRVIRTSINIHLHFLCFMAQETFSNSLENEGNHMLFTTFKEHLSLFPQGWSLGIRRGDEAPAHLLL